MTYSDHFLLVSNRASMPKSNSDTDEYFQGMAIVRFVFVGGSGEDDAEIEFAPTLPLISLV